MLRMYPRDNLEFPLLREDLPLDLEPGVDQVPVICGLQPGIVEEGSDAEVDQELETGTAVVEDEVGDLSGVAEDVVLDLQVVECVVNLSADVLAIEGIAGARASRTELSSGREWICEMLTWGKVDSQ